MILKIVNASFGYGKDNILKNVSLTAKKGELVAILGPNGAGKTTLLRCMLGFLKWKEGKSTLDDKDIRDIPHKKLWSPSLPRMWQISTAPPGVTNLPAAAMRTGHMRVAFLTSRAVARLMRVS